MQEGCVEQWQARFKVVPLPAIPAGTLPQGLPFKLPTKNPFLPDSRSVSRVIDPLARHCVLQPPAQLVATPTLRLWHLQATFVPPEAHVRSACRCWATKLQICDLCCSLVPQAQAVRRVIECSSHCTCSHDVAYSRQSGAGCATSSCNVPSAVQVCIRLMSPAFRNAPLAELLETMWLEEVTSVCSYSDPAGFHLHFSGSRGCSEHMVGSAPYCDGLFVQVWGVGPLSWHVSDSYGRLDQHFAFRMRHLMVAARTS